jgi:hypothetical protein
VLGAVVARGGRRKKCGSVAKWDSRIDIRKARNTGPEPRTRSQSFCLGGDEHLKCPGAVPRSDMLSALDDRKCIWDKDPKKLDSW